MKSNQELRDELQAKLDEAEERRNNPTRLERLHKFFQTKVGMIVFWFVGVPLFVGLFAVLALFPANIFTILLWIWLGLATVVAFCYGCWVTAEGLGM